MKVKKPWVEALNISIDDFNQWCEQVPKQEAITHWCLKYSKLPSASYIMWARNYYGLASLKDNFYDSEPNYQVWQQIQSVANWSEAMIPIDEWDGVVFVAAVEPDMEFTWSFPVQFVLGSAEGLEKYWAKLQNAPASAPQPEAPAQPKTPPHPEPTTPPASAAGTGEDFFAQLDQQVPEVAKPGNPEPEPAPEVVAEAPEGFADHPPEGLTEMPEGLSLEPEKPQPEPSEPTALDLPEVPQGMAPPAPTEQTNTEQTNTVTKTEFTATFNAAALEEMEAAEQAQQQAETQMAQQPPAPPVANLDDAKTEEEVTTWAFNELHKTFDKAMILIYQGDQLTPWKLDWKWTSEPDLKALAVDTAQPSIFRIIFRTGMPYHGPVVSSPANDKFFTAFGYKPIPEHVTACPIKYDSHQIGVIVAAGPSTANTNIALNSMEELTEKVAKALQRTKAKAA